MPQRPLDAERKVRGGLRVVESGGFCTGCVVDNTLIIAESYTNVLPSHHTR
jgi:hypothetical protein